MGGLVRDRFLYVKVNASPVRWGTTEYREERIGTIIHFVPFKELVWRDYVTARQLDLTSLDTEGKSVIPSWAEHGYAPSEQVLHITSPDYTKLCHILRLLIWLVEKSQPGARQDARIPMMADEPLSEGDVARHGSL